MAMPASPLTCTSVASTSANMASCSAMRSSSDSTPASLVLASCLSLTRMSTQFCAAISLTCSSPPVCGCMSLRNRQHGAGKIDAIIKTGHDGLARLDLRPFDHRSGIDLIDHQHVEEVAIMVGDALQRHVMAKLAHQLAQRALDGVIADQRADGD